MRWQTGQVRGNFGQNANVRHLTNTRLWFAPSLNSLAYNFYDTRNCCCDILVPGPHIWRLHSWGCQWVAGWQNGRMARWMATLHYSCSAKEANKLITLSAKHAMKCLKRPKISHNFRWLLCDLHLNLVLWIHLGLQDVPATPWWQDISNMHTNCTRDASLWRLWPPAWLSVNCRRHL